MKKYFDWFGIIPIAMVGMMFSLNTHKEMEEHSKKHCIMYFCYLIIFIMLYISLVYGKVNRHIAFFFAFIIWIIIFLWGKFSL